MKTVPIDATPTRRRTRWPALACLLAAGLCAAPAADADIYRYVDRNGVTHLSDRPSGPGWVLIMKGKRRAAPAASSSVNRRRYAPVIEQVARHHRLDAALVHAVVRAESAYDPNAVSRKGAVGLMQLMPGTARRYGVRDRYNPQQNLTGGVRYLKDLLAQFNDVVLALAAYNAGENAVLRHGRKVPPFPETRTYVRRVLTFYRELRSAS